MLQASNEGLGRVLDAVATATVIIGLLQQHHVKVIQPHVEASAAESAACSNGMSALIKSVEERVLASLQAALNAFFAQVPYSIAHISTLLSLTCALSNADCAGTSGVLQGDQCMPTTDDIPSMISYCMCNEYCQLCDSCCADGQDTNK